MGIDIRIYVDVQSLWNTIFRTSIGESYSLVQMRRNTDAENYGTQGNFSLFFRVVYNRFIVPIEKLIVLLGSWFTTIGIT